MPALAFDAETLIIHKVTVPSRPTVDVFTGQLFCTVLWGSS